MQTGNVILRGLLLLPAVASGILAAFVFTDKDTRLLALFLGSVFLQCLWLAFKGHHPKQRRLILFSVATGLVIGAIALYGGTVWAHWRYPDSNLAPILGVIATGPVGYAVGAILGILLSTLIQHRKSGSVPANKETEDIR